jgi:8-oxo-dGTP diphosphatase
MKNQQQKILPGRYQVIPRTLIFIRNHDEILLIKGAADKKIWPGLYNGIGGHIERGEDILTAAKRELFEESSIQNIDLELRAVIIIDVEEETGISMFVFSGQTNSTQTINSEEGALEWIKLDQLADFPLVEDLYQLIPLVFNSEQKIHYGKYYYKENRLIMDFN